MRGILAATVASVLTTAALAAASPETALEALQERQTAIERAQENLDRDPDNPEYNEALNRSIRDAFDFEVLARKSIDRHIESMTPEQLDEYLRLFEQLVEASTVKKLKSYRAAGTEYFVEEDDSTSALITTVVTSSDGDAVAIQYHLNRRNGIWRVCDTTIGLDTEITEFDVSTSQNYRSAFNKIIRDEGIDGLLQKLRDKAGNGADL